MGLLDMFKKKAQDPQVQQKVKGAVQNQMNRRSRPQNGGSVAPGMAGYPWMPGDPMYGQLFWPDQSIYGGQGVPGDYDGDGIPDNQEYGNQSQQGDSGYAQGSDPTFNPNDSGPSPDGQDYSDQGQYQGDGSSDVGGSDYSNDSSSYDQGGYSDGGSSSYSDGGSGSDYGSSDGSSYDSGGYDSGSSYDSGGGGDSGGF